MLFVKEHDDVTAAVRDGFNFVYDAEHSAGAGAVRGVLNVAGEVAANGGKLLFHLVNIVFFVFEVRDGLGNIGILGDEGVGAGFKHLGCYGAHFANFVLDGGDVDFWGLHECAWDVFEVIGRVFVVFFVWN